MERDFIMRQVQQLAAALARALVQRQSGQFEEAIGEIDATMRAHGISDIERFIHMSETELNDYLTHNGTLNSDFAGSLANLLEERGNNLQQNGQTTDAAACYAAARMILTIIHDSGSSMIPLDLEERINQLDQKIDHDP